MTQYGYVDCLWGIYEHKSGMANSYTRLIEKSREAPRYDDRVIVK